MTTNMPSPNAPASESPLTSWPPDRKGSDGAPCPSALAMPRTVIAPSGTRMIRPIQLVVSPVSRTPRAWSAVISQIRSAPPRNETIVPGSSIPKTVMPSLRAGKMKAR